MCFLWVPPTSVNPTAREYAGSGIRTNGTSRFIVVSVHCQKSRTIFLKKHRGQILFHWWQPIFFSKGGTIQSECISDIYIITGDIVKKIYSFRVSIFERCSFTACFYPCRNNITFQTHVPSMAWKGSACDPKMCGASSWWRAFDDPVCICFHISCIVPASSMWLFDSSNWGVFVNPWKGRSWGYFFLGRTGAHCDGWGSMFG